MFKDMSISNTLMEEFKDYAAKSSNVSNFRILFSWSKLNHFEDVIKLIL